MSRCIHSYTDTSGCLASSASSWWVTGVVVLATTPEQKGGGVYMHYAFDCHFPHKRNRSTRLHSVLMSSDLSWRGVLAFLTRVWGNPVCVAAFFDRAASTPIPDWLRVLVSCFAQIGPWWWVVLLVCAYPKTNCPYWWQPWWMGSSWTHGYLFCLPLWVTAAAAKASFLYTRPMYTTVLQSSALVHQTAKNKWRQKPQFTQTQPVTPTVHNSLPHTVSRCSGPNVSKRIRMLVFVL